MQVLCSLYTKTLSVLQRMPKEAAYRTQTEQIVQQRLQIVQAESNIPAIENKIGCGQVEELIDQVCVCIHVAHAHTRAQKHWLTILTCYL